jgi:hypothetical protein
MGCCVDRESDLLGILVLANLHACRSPADKAAILVAAHRVIVGKMSVSLCQYFYLTFTIRWSWSTSAVATEVGCRNCQPADTSIVTNSTNFTVPAA